MDTDTNHLSRRPPRGRLFADPAAAAVWAAVTALDVAVQHEILEELRERLAVPEVAGGDLRVRRAVAALREAHDQLGHSPSVNEYRELVRANDWPPDASVRRWLGGSWNDCLRRARLETVADGDILIVEQGPGFTGDEVVDALRACAGELGHVPSFSEYVGWAKRPDVVRRAGRRPMSQTAFTRLFGGYLPALVAAGLVSSQTAVEVPESAQVRFGSYFVEDVQIREALHEVTARLDHVPRVTEYQRERQTIIEESRASGQLRTLPSYAVIQRRYGTWDAALIEAGLTALGGRATGKGGRKNRGRAKPQVSEEVILEAIRRAYAAVGDPFTMTAYMRWRAEELARDPLARLKRSIPHYSVIHDRFGTWASAVAKALGE